MANRTNSSEYFWSYEYYWDYIDPIPVDGRKLKVNKYSIVIAFWVGLAAFVMFLFLILLYMSRSGSSPVKSKPIFYSFLVWQILPIDRQCFPSQRGPTSELQSFSIVSPG
uniref:Melanocortin 2 receptor accessory protein n=1 Tax=Anas platyrhynchos platyrhynchos TaxID=8840 RepID=U3I076_ANAPP